MSIELLQGYTNSIRKLNKDIKDYYIEIARYLKQIRDSNCLQDTSYKNVADYALKEFGYERSTVYNLIAVYEKFFEIEKNKKIDILTYIDFSITQLYIMLTMTEEQLKMCNPNMTVKEIKLLKIKKSNRLDSVGIENTENLKNEIPGQNVITGIFPEKSEEEKQSTLIISELPKSELNSASAATETRTVVTETITSQNNNFVPNDYETYKEKYEQNCKDAIKLNIEMQELKHKIDMYKEIINYISDSLINSKSFVTDNHIVNLNHEISTFLKNGKLPKKVQFMQEVI